MVRIIADKDEFDRIIRETSGLIMVDFFATWCGPCVAISPWVTEIEAQYPSVLFLKIDVDEADEISNEAKIEAMPTFIFYKAGNKIAEVKGADRNTITAFLTTHQ